MIETGRYTYLDIKSVLSPQSIILMLKMHFTSF